MLLWPQSLVMIGPRNRLNLKHLLLDIFLFKSKGEQMKKLNATLIVEVVGVACVTTGLAILSVPVALIVLGSFLVWITEKGN
jgi:hypothetical protein